jgi:hypothetical protein
VAGVVRKQLRAAARSWLLRMVEGAVRGERRQELMLLVQGGARAAACSACATSGGGRVDRPGPRCLPSCGVFTTGGVRSPRNHPVSRPRPGSFVVSSGVATAERSRASLRRRSGQQRGTLRCLLPHRGRCPGAPRIGSDLMCATGVFDQSSASSLGISTYACWLPSGSTPMPEISPRLLIATASLRCRGEGAIRLLRFTVLPSAERNASTAP